MAVFPKSLIITRRRQTDQEGGKKWTQVCSVLIGCLVAVVAGAYGGWTSPCLPKLVDKGALSQSEADLIFVIGPLGTVIGAPVASTIVDRWGRRNSLIITTLIQIIGLIMHAKFTSVHLLGFARVLAFLSDGFFYVSLPMFIGEVAEPSIRGRLGACELLALTTGCLVVNIFGMLFDVEVTSFLLLIIPLSALLLLLWTHDSPYYHLMKKDEAKAKKSLIFYRRTKNVDPELAELKIAVERQMADRGTLMSFLRIPVNRRALLICLGLRLLQNFSGILVINLHVQVVMADTGSHLTGLQSSVVFLAVETMAIIIIGMMSMDRFNKKTILCLSAVASGCCMLAIVAYRVADDYTDYSMNGLHWLPLTAILIYVVAVNAGICTVPFVCLSEMFSMSVKSHALNVCAIVWSTATATTAELYVFTSTAIGSYAPFAIFSLFCFLTVPFALFMVPDTRGKTLEEIQQGLIKRLR